MDEKRNLSSVSRVTLVAIWLLFLVNFAAMKFSIYYTLSWFDTAVHFFGGIVTALVVYIILARLKLLKYKTPFRFIITIIIASFCVGFFWEIVEYVVNILIPVYAFDIVDTVSDLIADTCGATLSAIILFTQRKRLHHGNK